MLLDKWLVNGSIDTIDTVGTCPVNPALTIVVVGKKQIPLPFLLHDGVNP